MGLPLTGTNLTDNLANSTLTKPGPGLTSSMSSLMLLLYSWGAAVMELVVGTGVEDWEREL